MPVTAPITNISGCSLHDGPGVRTVVYFKGCPLSCRWCHNPETQAMKPQILYLPQKCIHCGACLEVCPEHHVIRDGQMVYLREGCTGCGRCAEICPSRALELCGEEKTVDEVFARIEKDRHYYDASGGGVTFSGGECLLHTEFLTRLAEKCHKAGIHTAVESALHVPWEKVAPLIPHIDLSFGDLKIPDPEKHRCYTGRSNDRILENLRRLSREADNIILRIPVIPGVNDSREDLEGFARIIRTFGNGVKEVELLKYNPLAKSKYTFLDEEYTAFSQESQTDSRMRELCDLLQEQCGLRCYFV